MGNQKLKPRSKSVAVSGASIGTSNSLSVPVAVASNVPKPSGNGLSVLATKAIVKAMQ